MDIANLIRMANRIGQFFEAMPDRTAAMNDIALHIRRFWEPRMRTALLDFLEEHPDGCLGDVCLMPLVREAVVAQADALRPAARAINRHPIESKMRLGPRPPVPVPVSEFRSGDESEVSLPAWSLFSVRKVREGVLQSQEDDALVEEVPVALEFNGISHATLLVTPTHLEDYARGFALTEGIIERASDIRGIDVEPHDLGVIVKLEISAACEARLKIRRRTMAGRTGCGLCGIESLEQVHLTVPPLQHVRPVSLSAVRRAQQEMRAAQAVHDATGASHAAALAREDGSVRWVREDVGRHNALDKLVGIILQEAAQREGFIVVSSRASFEMVQKTAMAGFSTLVAVSAPTALAVRQARAAGMVLVGFQRGANATVYAGAERVVA